jgi:hypothetical protein
LVCGKNVYLSSQKPEGYGGNCIDVFMPLEIFWEVRDLLKQADFLVASDGDPAAINQIYLTVFQKVAAYATTDKDRNWLYTKINSG